MSCTFSTAVHAQAAYSAAYVSETVPSFIAFQTPASASVTMQNTGTATWIRGDVFLSTQQPQDNYYWCIQGNPYGMYSGNRVLLPNDVAPQQQVTFNFVVKPLACGFTATAPFVFRMLSQTHGTFGEETPNPGVVVSTATQFVSQQVPAAVPAGATVLVTETFTNTTTTTWQTTDGYTLGPAGGPAEHDLERESGCAARSRGAERQRDVHLLHRGAGDAGHLQFPVADEPARRHTLRQRVSGDQRAGDRGGPRQLRGPVVEQPGRIGVRLGHQSRPSGRHDFRDLVYLQPGRQGVVAQHDCAAQRERHLFRHALSEHGPPFNSVPFNPALVRSTVVGAGTLTFTDPDNGTFAYTVNGITQTKTITREVFGVLPTCTFGILSDLTLAYNYQDLWWAAPGGCGVGMGRQPHAAGRDDLRDVVYLRPRWNSALAGGHRAANRRGHLQRHPVSHHRPAFNAVPFLPAAVTATAVGTATFTFTDGNTGTFDYTVNGVAQTKAITREIFVSPGTVCQ